MRKTLFSVLVAVMAMGFLWQSTAFAADDEYPSKQINWYIHSSAGGGTDIFSRTVALRLRRELKANIVISTMSGGSGARMLNHLMEQPAEAIPGTHLRIQTLPPWPGEIPQQVGKT